MNYMESDRTIIFPLKSMKEKKKKASKYIFRNTRINSRETAQTVIVQKCINIIYKYKNT